MTDFEKIIIKSQLLNTKMNLILTQQASLNFIANNSLLFGVQQLLEKIHPSSPATQKLTDTLTQMGLESQAVTLLMQSLTTDIKELNKSIDSFDDDSIDLSNFKFSLN